jgi:PhoPQ-activated pathogenicity-related protein
MRKECKDGEQMKRMVEWQDPEHLYTVLCDLNPLTNTLKINQVVIFVDEGTKREDESEAQYDSEDEQVHSLPL